MNWERSERLRALPPYLFAEIARARRQAAARGVDVINLGVGDPDRPTFEFIRQAMHLAVEDPANHTYPFDEGVPQFRAAAADFLQHRYGVALDAAGEIITTIGSKDGIAHLPLAVVNPGQTVLVPSPGYPVYNAGAVFVGAKVLTMPLRADNNWLPEFEKLSPSELTGAKLIWVNYPNNPTAQVAELAWYERLVAWARRHNIIIASDAAYGEMYYETPPPSILQVAGAKDVAVEFHSLSKTFNMTGWRLGFAAGNAQVIAALAAVKSNVDSGQFNAIQWAGLAALKGYDRPEVVGQRELYRARRDALCDGLARLGYHAPRSPATFYVWAGCPKGVDSMTFCKRVLEKAGVVFIPGVGFGPTGEGYFRAALTVEVERIRQALDRLAGLKW